MLTKEATSSTVVATSSGLICHSLAAFFQISVNMWLNSIILDKCKFVGGIYVLHTVICFVSFLFVTKL